MKRTLFLISSIASVFLFSCGNPTDDDNNNNQDTVKVDSNKSLTVEVGGKIFSVPSPIQTAFLIKKSGAQYNSAMLNPSNKSNSYSTNYLKALNLGVYGADMGYVTLYDQTQDALGYFQSVKKLADDLGVSSAFDKVLLERFQKNLGKRDSMLNLVSSAYRSSDAFLKNNDRSDISALIIAGGWIEGLYFATKIAQEKANDEVVRRVAEQKTSLNSLIALLQQNAAQEEYAELIAGLKSLNEVFEKIEYKYTYDKPITDEKKKTTTFTSKTEVVITPEQLKSISEKIENIRKMIVG